MYTIKDEIYLYSGVHLISHNQMNTTLPEGKTPIGCIIL